MSKAFTSNSETRGREADLKDLRGFLGNILTELTVIGAPLTATMIILKPDMPIIGANNQYKMRAMVKENHTKL